MHMLHAAVLLLLLWYQATQVQGSWQLKVVCWDTWIASTCLWKRELSCLRLGDTVQRALLQCWQAGR
jgi:hypothetical protein